MLAAVPACPGDRPSTQVPPYMKPAKMQHLLSQFGQVTRIYLAEEDQALARRRKKAGGNKNKCYTEGWAEYKDKKVRRRRAAACRGSSVAPRKNSVRGTPRVRSDRSATPSNGTAPPPPPPPPISKGRQDGGGLAQRDADGRKEGQLLLGRHLDDQILEALQVVAPHGEARSVLFPIELCSRRARSLLPRAAAPLARAFRPTATHRPAAPLARGPVAIRSLVVAHNPAFDRRCLTAAARASLSLTRHLTGGRPPADERRALSRAAARARPAD